MIEGDIGIVRIVEMTELKSRHLDGLQQWLIVAHELAPSGIKLRKHNIPNLRRIDERADVRFQQR